MIRTTTVILLALLLGAVACTKSPSRQLTLAVVTGVEGEALKQAALDYKTQTGVHINVTQFPYASLFEKELIDFRAEVESTVWLQFDAEKVHFFESGTGARKHE